MTIKILPLLLLLALPLVAQAQEAPDSATNENTAAGAAKPEEQGKATANEPGPAARDPSDYEASEQISEDLSVSFPVDI